MWKRIVCTRTGRAHEGRWSWKEGPPSGGSIPFEGLNQLESADQ